MSYNGWTDYETWNCALWMANDEGIYNMALGCETYDDFLDVMLNEWGQIVTGDNVKWTDAHRGEIVEAFNELKGG